MVVLVLEAGQLPQEASEVAANTLEYLPAAHSVHVDSAAAPDVAEYLPAPQAEQSVPAT